MNLSGLSGRLTSWAQNEEMVDQGYTQHGKDCLEAVAKLNTLREQNRREGGEMKSVAALLPDPVPYGATRYEVQREATAGTAAHRVAIFDRLEDAQQYVHASNAYPRLIEALRRSVNTLREIKRDAASLRGVSQFAEDYEREARAILRELGEDA